MNRQYLLAVATLLAMASATFGQEVTLDASRDNTLYQDAAGGLSNGAGVNFFAGSTASNAIRRGLIAFDVAAAIPVDATIQEVELTLTMNMTVSGDQDVSLHSATTDWGEGTSDTGANGGGGAGAAATPGDATWLHTFWDTNFWTTAGGDFNPTASATQTVASNGAYVWGSTPQMVADVQTWLDDPVAAFGWVIVGNEGANASAKRFASRESNMGPPQLRIVYSTTPLPPLPGIPTLSTTFLGILALLLMIGGTAVLRRH